MTPAITIWAHRNSISSKALAELRLLFGLGGSLEHTGPIPPLCSEAGVQSRVRLGAAQAGYLAFRNNVGVLRDENGRPVRYGLANDSKAVNKELKSGDLIGVRPRLITPEDIGSTIGQFWSRECKPFGWKFTGSDREIGQLNWITLITSRGGDASFTTGGI